MAKKPTAADIKASYGFVGQLADNIPELKKILQKAVKGQWTQDRFLMAVSDTKWYRSNSAAMRQWITTKAVDPKEAAAQLDSAYQTALRIAAETGLPLDRQELTETALAGMLGSMDEADLRFHMNRKYFRAEDYDLQESYGQVAENVTNIRQMASAYGIFDPNDAWTREQLQEVMHGRETIESVQQRAINYAKSKYAQFRDRLDAGETISDIARPGMDAARELLEQDISMNDPLIQKYLQARGEDGQPADMPVWQLEQMARKDSRYQYTSNAKQQVGEILQTIGSNWGFVA